MDQRLPVMTATNSDPILDGSSSNSTDSQNTPPATTTSSSLDLPAPSSISPPTASASAPKDDDSQGVATPSTATGRQNDEDGKQNTTATISPPSPTDPGTSRPTGVPPGLGTDLATTPGIGQISPPTTAPTDKERSSCPDLRDRISIDISITTTTTKANNNSSISDRGSRNEEPISAARALPRVNMAARRGRGRRRASLVLSTAEHSVGTVVTVSCARSSQHRAVVLECRPGGVWNATLPSCGKAAELDTSPYPLYLALGGGAVGLILLVLFFLYCHLLHARGDGKAPKRGSRREQDSEGNLYVDPYHVGERLYRTPGSPRYARTDIAYAKPVVYSTYLNPAFYEDAYERWRRQEQMVSEKLYDSPWLKPRGLQKQMETPGFRWSQTSLKAIEDSGFKKLPRVQLTYDHASTRSNASIGSLRARDQRSGQSAATASCEVGMLRCYPSMAAHAPRPNTTATGSDALTEDQESMHGLDVGLTNL